MERTPDVILMEIKEALRSLCLKVEELENIMGAQDTAFAGDSDDFIPMDPVDLDIELGESSETADMPVDVLVYKNPVKESVAESEPVAGEPAEEPVEESAAETEEPAIEPVEEPAAEAEDLPEAAAEPEPESAAEEPVEIPSEGPAAEPEPEPAVEPTAVEPVEDTVPEPVAEPEPEPVVKPEPEAAAKPAVIDVMTKTRAWKIDMPGSPVSNILSAISLNDRILFINALFDKDPVLFQSTIRLLNSFSSLSQAEDHIAANFPKWNMDSDTVYRFMMAVRRKLS